MNRCARRKRVFLNRFLAFGIAAVLTFTLAVPALVSADEDAEALPPAEQQIFINDEGGDNGDGNPSSDGAATLSEEELIPDLIEEAEAEEELIPDLIEEEEAEADEDIITMSPFVFSTGPSVRLFGTVPTLPAGAKLSHPNTAAQGYRAADYPASGQPGAVQMAKSAAWTNADAGEAEIVFNLWGNQRDSGDVIILLDSSVSTNQDNLYAICPLDGAHLSGTPTWNYGGSGASRTATLNALTTGGQPHTHAVPQIYSGPGSMNPGPMNYQPFLPQPIMRLSAEKGAANHYIDQLADNGHGVAVINFARDVVESTGFTDNIAAHNAIMRATYSSTYSTQNNYAPAFAEADRLIRSRTDQSRPVTILLISNGYPDDGLGIRQIATNLKSWNYYYQTGAQVTIEAIGIGVLNNLGEYGVSLLWEIISDGSQGYQSFNGDQIIYNNHARIFKSTATPSTNQLNAAVESLAARMTTGTPPATSAILTDIVSDDFEIIGVDTHGVGTALFSGQTVTWTVGSVPTSSDAKLTISVRLKNPKSVNTEFPTNNGDATLTYKNFNNTNCTQYVETPVLTRTNAAILLEYYLVNELGQTLNSAGDVTANIADRVVLKPAEYLKVDGTLSASQVALAINTSYPINTTDPINGFKSLFQLGTKWYQWTVTSTQSGNPGWNPASPITTEGSGTTTTKYFGFKEYNPNPTDPTSFTKKVSIDGNTWNTAAYIVNADVLLSYQIEVVFPSDMSGYNAVSVQDILPDALDYIDASGRITIDGLAPAAADGQLTYTPADKTLTYTFANDYDFTKLAGTTLQLTLSATINKGKLNAEGSTVIVNDAKLLINEGTARPPIPPIILPQKPNDFSKVLAPGQSAEIPQRETDEFVDYEISFTFPTDMTGWSTFLVKDVLPVGMDIDPVDVTITLDGTDITQDSFYPIQRIFEGGHLAVLYSLGNYDQVWADLPGKHIIMHVRAAFIGTPNVGDAFRNEAVLGINYEDIIRIDGPEITIIDGGIADPTSYTKKVSTNGGNTYSLLASVIDIDAPLKYQIEVVFPDNMNGYRSVSVKDILPVELNYVADSGTITIDGVTPLPEDGVLVYTAADKTLTYTFASGYDFTRLAGRTLQLTLAATIDRSKLSATGTTIITNDSKLFINEDTARPLIPPIYVPEKPADFIKVLSPGQPAEIPFEDVDKFVDYDISFTFPTDMTGWMTFMIKDLLPPGMDLDPAHVTVTLDGIDITHAGLYPIQKTVENGTTVVGYCLGNYDSIWTSLPGKKIVMHLRATFIGTPNVGDTFQNEALLRINKEDAIRAPGPIVTIVDPPHQAPRAFIKEVSIDGGNTYSLRANVVDLAAPLCYRVSVVFPNDMSGYRTVSVQDILPEALNYVTGSGQITVDGLTPSATDGMLAYVPADKTLTYTFAAGYDFNRLAGRTLQLTLYAIIDQSKLSRTGATIITNDAKLFVNDAQTRPPIPPVFVPKKPADFIKTFSEGQPQEVAMTDIDQYVRYDISFTFPADMSGWDTFMIKDILPPGMYLDPADVTVTLDGIDITNEGFYPIQKTVDGNVITVGYCLGNYDSIWTSLPGKRIVMHLSATFAGTPMPGDIFQNEALLRINKTDAIREDGPIVHVV
ncbi:MAG: isopeptide-forming domain-containing fimbrial protein [Clostridiales Family XIII bacterium]|jgi:fimbrial isopeptide formation D2 family protein|nr:isopeptide-forming domain-containing fimbrial protein [Clostridiales Family XIII bacterium]